MRVFWSLMLMMFVASMGVFVVPSRATQEIRAESPDAVRAIEMPRAATAEAVLEPHEDGGDIEAGTQSDLHSPEAEPMPQGTTETALANPAPVETALAESTLGVAGLIEPKPAATDPFAAAAAAYSQSISELPAEDQKDSAPLASTEPDVVEGLAVVGAGDFEESEVDLEEDVSVVVQPDGSLLIDGTISVPGDGSVANPFVLEWSLLTGVAREYKPEQGKEILPRWLGVVEGKSVRLTGHVVLPLVSTTTQELLLTMNPWDGCCVGVPPTPYDALEVTLGEEIPMEGTSMYGSVEGVFRTDPYIVSGWLLGLYLLDDARVLE